MIAGKKAARLLERQARGGPHGAKKPDGVWAFGERDVAGRC
jgi:hypothetical protein